MDAIGMIQEEHRRIAAVLHCLQRLAGELPRVREMPDLAPFEAIVDYMQSFPARFHHPKEEEYLFRALDARAPELKPVLAKLRSEHAEGEGQLLELSRALERLRANPDRETGFFREVVDRYVAFERNHMALEEREVLPRARSALSHEQQAAIERAFTGNDDPLFSPARRQKYQDLYSHVLSTVPQPHGFADPWKTGSKRGEV